MVILMATPKYGVAIFGVRLIRERLQVCILSFVNIFYQTSKMLFYSNLLLYYVILGDLLSP